MNIDIQNFYLNIPTDKDLPTLDKVMNASFEWIEATHNWCQRAFSNFEPSEIIGDAPVLDQETLEWIKNSYDHMTNASKLALRYMVHHYNKLDPKSNIIHHNNRRVTRLIKFLVMLELNDLAEGIFFQAMAHCGIDEVGHTNTYGEVMTKTYWEEALNYKREK